MERICFTFTIKPGTDDEYRRRHDEIWPELLEAITESGFRNYSLSRRGLEVIAYAERVPDVETTFGKLGGYDVNQRWSEWFEDIVDSLTDETGNVRRADEVCTSTERGGVGVVGAATAERRQGSAGRRR